MPLKNFRLGQQRLYLWKKYTLATPTTGTKRLYSTISQPMFNRMEPNILPSGVAGNTTGSFAYFGSKRPWIISYCRIPNFSLHERIISKTLFRDNALKRKNRIPFYCIYRIPCIQNFYLLCIDPFIPFDGYISIDYQGLFHSLRQKEALPLSISYPNSTTNCASVFPNNRAQQEGFTVFQIDSRFRQPYPPLSQNRLAPMHPRQNPFSF